MIREIRSTDPRKGWHGQTCSPARIVRLAIPALAALTAPAIAQSRYEQTHSRNQFVHWIHLYDADGQRIDPSRPDAPPYSPAETCAKCHDYQAISRGYHFNAADPEAADGRPGEPWVWTDRRSGSQVPLSYRDWPGLYQPDELRLSAWEFVLLFGRHMPGGGIGEPRRAGTAESEDARRPLAGKLAIDCMLCHTDDRTYKPEVWAEQIDKQNLAWAPTAALGLAAVEGEVRRLPADFDPAAAEASDAMPGTHYYPHKFDAEGRAFFDVVRTPPNNACYYCHTARPVGPDAPPRWTHDEDVHLRAGLRCADCHRNGIDHHTVRGYEGERHPSGRSIATLSCRGCHLGAEAAGAPAFADLGGRLGAPRPTHRGIPPLHFDKLTCTACHSGPLPQPRAGRAQTSMAHALGLPSQQRGDDDPPGIVSPVFLRDRQGRIAPHRMVWPAFWGRMADDGRITPIRPDEAYTQIRRALRVRRDFQEELGEARLSRDERAQHLGADRAAVPDAELTAEERAKLQQAQQTKAAAEFREKLGRALQTLSNEDGGAAVYISGGRAYRLAEDGRSVETFEHTAAEPYAWPLAHDVRPAGRSLGVRGCADCHAADAPFQYGAVTAVGPAPDPAPPAVAMHELQRLDLALLAAWDNLFQGRAAFKALALVSLSIVAAVVLLYGLLGLGGVLKYINRKLSRPS